MGAKVTGKKRAKGSKNFRSRERKGQAISLQGAKVPWSEMAGERIGQVPTGRFAPGSEWARERKGSVPQPFIGRG